MKIDMNRYRECPHCHTYQACLTPCRKCDRCLHNTPISGCVHEEGWRHYYEEDTVTECEWFEEAKK